jgi:hypothetical protein
MMTVSIWPFGKGKRSRGPTTLDVQRALRFAENPEPSPSEGRRAAARQSKWAVCKITFIDEHGSLSGVLVDVSETGARVRFVTGGGHISRQVRLEAPVIGLRRNAELVWRDRTEAGFRFTSAQLD